MTFSYIKYHLNSGAEPGGATAPLPWPNQKKTPI